MKGDINEKDIKHENPRQTMQHGKSWSYKDRKNPEKARPDGQVRIRQESAGQDSEWTLEDDRSG